MPWYDGNIPAKFKTALERKTGAKFALEVVLDPDGAAVALNADRDIVDISEIGQERDLDIEEGGMAYIPDVTITFNDLDNYFDPDNTASPFHQCEATLSEDAAASATTIKLLSWDGVAFAADEVLTISDETNSETVVVDTFTADVSTGYHTLTIDAPGLVAAYAAGSRIHTANVIGKNLLVRLVNLTESTTEKPTLFNGEIIKDPELSPGQARITCADARKRALDSTLVGADSDSTNKLMCVGTDGALRSSIVWPNEFNVPPMTYVISDGALPAGLTMDSSTGAISGTPTTAGSYSFTVRVTNADGEEKSQDCTLVVYDRINEDFDSAYGLTDYDTDGPTNTEFSLSAGGEGYLRISFNLPTGYASTWDNVSGQTELINASIVSPGTLTGNWVMLARINAANFPTHTNDCIVGLFVDKSSDDLYGMAVGYNMSNSQVAGYDINNANRYGPVTGVASDLIFRLRKVSNTYYFDYRTPTGAWTNLGSKGSESWTPGKIGIGYFQYGASPQYLSGSFDVDYFRAYYGALAVASTSLPFTRAGDVYDFTLRASGGAGEYAWDISTGSLPAGLSLNASTGAITGTVTADGTTNFTVRVTDGAGTTATQAVSIVASADNEIVPDIWPWGEDNVAYDEPLRLYVGGGLDRDQVTVGSRCPLGQWSFKWTSATAFECTPPGMTMVTGDIASEFSIDSVITIPAAAWSAGMAANDQMTFITGITWVNENPVQMIYDLQVDRMGLPTKQIDASAYFGDIELGLVTAYNAITGYNTIAVTLPRIIGGSVLRIVDFGGTQKPISVGNTMASSWPPTISVNPFGGADYTGLLATIKQYQLFGVNVINSFDAEYEYCRDAGISVSMTLDRSMTVAQAIEAICQHVGIIQYHHFGLECLHIMRPRLQSTVQKLTASEIKPEVTTESEELVNVITIQYAYDYVAQEYTGTYTYPETSAANPSYRRYGKEVSKTIYCPGIYDDELAKLTAQRKYEQYAAGLQKVTVNCDLRALLMKLGERWDLEIDDPDIVGRFETIAKSVTPLGARGVELTGYNSSIFDKFGLAETAMADVSAAW